MEIQELGQELIQYLYDACDCQNKAELEKIAQKIKKLQRQFKAAYPKLFGLFIFITRALAVVKKKLPLLKLKSKGNEEDMDASAEVKETGKKSLQMSKSMMQKQRGTTTSTNLALSPKLRKSIDRMQSLCTGFLSTKLHKHNHNHKLNFKSHKNH